MKLQTRIAVQPHGDSIRSHDSTSPLVYRSVFFCILLLSILSLSNKTVVVVVVEFAKEEVLISSYRLDTSPKPYIPDTVHPG